MKPDARYAAHMIITQMYMAKRLSEVHRVIVVRSWQLLGKFVPSKIGGSLVCHDLKLYSNAPKKHSWTTTEESYR